MDDFGLQTEVKGDPSAEKMSRTSENKLVIQGKHLFMQGLQIGKWALDASVQATIPATKVAVNVGMKTGEWITTNVSSRVAADTATEMHHSNGDMPNFENVEQGGVRFDQTEYSAEGYAQQRFAAQQLLANRHKGAHSQRAVM
jgi:hypothetical protein